MKISGRALRARKIRFGDVRGMPKLFFPAEVRRDQTFRFRVTAAEKQLIEQLAHDCGMTASDYCRRQSLAKRTRSKLGAIITNELSQLNLELKRQRENMEHADNYGAILAEIAEAIERIPMEDF